MSKRAVEKAIAYADKKLQVVDPELWETSYTRYRKMSLQVMSGGDVEEAYQNGYEQAEKDLALTKEDVRTIFNLVRELQVKYSSTEGCLQEVADIFNEQRKK